jgi:hypothetical protein
MQNVTLISTVRRFAMLCLTMSLSCIWSSGQEGGQLGARFKKLTAFEIQPGVLALATFSIDGSVCRLKIEKLGIGSI